MKNQLYFTCFKSKKKSQDRYFRATEISSGRKIGHGEGYSKASSALHAIVLIKDKKFKIEYHQTGKTHMFSLVARNGEVIFQSNRYKDKQLMMEDVALLMECQNSDVLYE